MKKILLVCILGLGISTSLLSQVVAFSNVNRSDVNLRGSAIVVGQVTLNAPSNGQVILRFDGHCLSSEGDRIILAASDNTNWAPNDGSVELEAADSDINSNAFSHTRSYEVTEGPKTFYAVAQNAIEMDGTGIASVYGTLTAEWFPAAPEPGKAFAMHKGFFYENVLVEGAPTAFNSITFNAPESGKVLVRFDGKCVSSYGDLMFFAASNTPNWSNYEGSTTNEIINNDLNRFSFSHVRTYNIGPGSHTFYAVAENYYEIYGNGFASIYGSLTVEFYPDGNPSTPILQNVSTPFGVNIEGPPVTVGQIQVNAPVNGKVELNFVGTCLGNHGDQIRLAASNEQNWAPDDGNITFEPYSADLNRVSFSHTRVYEVGPGNHDFYAVVQNYEEYDGGGLAVIYASFTAKFFPEGTIAVKEPVASLPLEISPNPASDRIVIDCPSLANQTLSWTLSDAKGGILKNNEMISLGANGQLELSVSDLLPGIYFIRFMSETGTATKRLIRI